MTTHIWLCLDRPFAYQKLDVDDRHFEEAAEILALAEEQIKDHLEGDHIHEFKEARQSPMGWYIFHTCPGKAEVLGDHIVLGEN